MDVISLDLEDASLAVRLLRGWWHGRKDEGFLPPSPAREPGPHVTDILYDLMERSGLVKASKPLTDDNPDGLLRATVGFAWEDIVGDILGRRAQILSQARVERDGIIGSIDGLDAKSGLIEEWKATWMSEATAWERNFRWLAQIKAYLACTGMDTAILRVLHVSPYPRSRSYRLTFTQNEIDENWLMLLNHHRWLTSRGLLYGGGEKKES